MPAQVMIYKQNHNRTQTLITLRPATVHSRHPLQADRRCGLSSTCRKRTNVGSDRVVELNPYTGNEGGGKLPPTLFSLNL